MFFIIFQQLCTFKRLTVDGMCFSTYWSFVILTNVTLFQNLQLMNMQCANCIQYCNNHNAYIGKDSKPHICNSKRS